MNTPGPWRVRPQEKRQRKYGMGPAVMREDGMIIAQTIFGAVPYEETGPNAALIAAAPDLLTACEQVLPLLRKIEPDAGPCAAYVAALIESVCCAIALAKGG